MTEPSPVTPLLAALRHLLNWLDEEGIRGVIVGGVAASILGEPRFTRDIDALVILEPNRWAKLLETGEQHGFEPRLSDAIEFARRSSPASPSLQRRGRGPRLWSPAI